MTGEYGELAIEALEHEKDLLRTELESRRSQRTNRSLSMAAAGITRQLTDLVATLGLDVGDTVAAYVSRRAEPGTLVALDVLHDAGLEVLLPVLGPTLDRRWGIFTGASDLAQRAPGRPLEPTAGDDDASALARAKLVLVPALAVDEQGIRLGRGGGWYDRALLHASPRASVVAVVYDEESHHPPLPHAGHDIPVGGVLTPTSWWRLDAA